MLEVLLPSANYKQNDKINTGPVTQLLLFIAFLLSCFKTFLDTKEPEIVLWSRPEMEPLIFISLQIFQRGGHLKVFSLTPVMHL